MQIIRGLEPLPPRIIYYADIGFGKSTFASFFPNPLFIRAGDGARNLDVDKSPACLDWHQFESFIDYVVANDTGHKTLVIDTIDEAEALGIKYVCQDVMKKEDTVDVGFARAERKVAGYIQALLDKLDYLNRSRKMMIVILAHPKIKEIKDPIKEPYDKCIIACNEKYVVPLLDNWADCVFFGAREINVKEAVSVSGKKRAKVLGGQERILYTSGHPGLQAKNRYELPDKIELSPNLGELKEDVEGIISLIRAHMARGKKKAEEPKVEEAEANKDISTDEIKTEDPAESVKAD